MLDNVSQQHNICMDQLTYWNERKVEIFESIASSHELICPYKIKYPPVPALPVNDTINMTQNYFTSSNNQSSCKILLIGRKVRFTVLFEIDYIGTIIADHGNGIVDIKI